MVPYVSKKERNWIKSKQNTTFTNDIDPSHGEKIYQN